MKGAREYAKLFKTGQYGKLYIVSSSHARGYTFRIQVLPEGEIAISNGNPNNCLNSDAVEVYAVIEGNTGWTESYGWLFEGKWQEDFYKLVRLKRFQDFDGDLDLILPYYQLLEKEGFSVVEDLEDRPSGSDYRETILINGVKADIRIDPSLKYKVVDYKGYSYKVVPLETIIEAKARYAKTKWGKKHKEDLQEMILNKNK